MNIFEFSLLVWAGSFAAGFLGALTGLGGGVVIVPLLTSVFGVDIRYAIGASLISVIATSAGSAATYIRSGFANLRLGMFLEVATTLGSFVGATLATVVPVKALTVVLGSVLLYSAFLAQQPSVEDVEFTEPGSLAERLQLDNCYPAPNGEGTIAYTVRSVPTGFSLMAVAGLLSGLLGIGSGSLKVLAMDRVMGLPFKVSTTTSNFTIGVTAAMSAGVYLSRGYVDPGLSMPVMLGVLMGAMAGARVLIGAKPEWLRWLFSLVLVALALKMIYNGLMV